MKLWSLLESATWRCHPNVIFQSRRRHDTCLDLRNPVGVSASALRRFHRSTYDFPRSPDMSLTFVKKAALAAGVITLAASASVFAADQQLTGAGSTAIYPVLAAWSDTYHKDTGIA